MTLALFYPDTAYFIDDTKGDSNNGVKIQAHIARQNQEKDMTGLLHIGIFTEC